MHLAFSLKGFSVFLTTSFEIGVKISHSVLCPMGFNGRNKDFGTQHNCLSFGLPGVNCMKICRLFDFCLLCLHT